MTEVLSVLAPKAGDAYLDATLGLAGHAQAILAQTNGQLYGFDADKRNLTLAKKTLKDYPQKKLFHANFSEVADYLPESSVDLILMDLGISSPHLDDASRGFSFAADGPLDMRLNTTQKKTAADIVNHSRPSALADIFYQYGEIHSSRRLAETITQRRKKQPFTTTKDLADVITHAYSKNLLPQAFQALRIAVNDELASLTHALPLMLSRLKPGGRLAVISFHSLEDRIVKDYFRTLATAKRINLLTKKPLAPTESEIRANPRSRSAKLRALSIT